MKVEKSSRDLALSPRERAKPECELSSTINRNCHSEAPFFGAEESPQFLCVVWRTFPRTAEILRRPKERDSSG